MIGLLGSHRVGKTTLCKALVNGNRGVFSEVPISISELQRGMGYDSGNQSYDWETRKNIQNRLLAAFSNILNDRVHTTGMLHVQRITMDVSERTPLDLVGYLLLNTPEYVSEEDAAWIKNYINNCIELTNECYSRVFLLQPGIGYVPDTKSPGQESMDKLNAIYLSLLMDSKLEVERVIIPEDVTDLEERICIVMGDTYESR